MEKLTWFKFTPIDWMMGKIQRCPEVTQARFLRLCALYWNKQCELTEQDAIIEIDEEHLKLLESKKIISCIDGVVNISFLDEQFLDIKEMKQDKSKSGVIGNLKRWHPAIYARFKDKKISLEDAIKESQTIADQSHTDSTPIADQSQTIADKKRGEKIRLDDIREDDNFKKETDYSKPPTNPDLNNLNISELSKYMLNSDEHLKTFEYFYPEKEYKQCLIDFYNHKMKSGSLTDSFNNYSRHFFNWIKLQQ